MNQRLKDAATDFLTLCAAGHAYEAFPKYASADLHHHNPWFADDAKTLMTAMDNNAAQYPDKTIEIFHTLEDGNLVATHPQVRMGPDQSCIQPEAGFHGAQDLLVVTAA